MIKETEIKTIRTERRISDYCKGCNYFSPERILLRSDKTGESYLETCDNTNMCAELYQRVIRIAKDQYGI